MDERYAQVKQEFHKIDRFNGDGYREFFLKYPFLSTNDIAQIVGRCAANIRKCKRLAGLGSKNPSKPPRHVPVPIIVDVPENWDTKEWLESTYEQYGCRTIARITGRPICTIYRKLKKYGIQLKDRNGYIIKNPCFSEEWIRNHYKDMEMSIAKCSRLAGVSKDTFTGWLNHFKFEVRGITYGPSVGEVDGV